MAGLKSASDVINALIAGELDETIEIKGSPAQRKLLSELEKLRITMRDMRDRELKDAAANKMAVASVAHDMKTPLALISGYAECIQAEMDDKDYPALIIEKAQQMNESVIGLVESLQQAEKVGVNREYVNVNPYLRNEFLRHKALADSKNIKLKVWHAPDYFIYADIRALSRVVQNLISNAVKYTPEKGKIVVRIIKSGKYVSVSVKDNGKGIEKDNLPFVFDKFYMEDGSRSSNSSGLGLYVVKQIIEKHGGVVKVRSKKEKGSKFVFKLPIEKNPPEDLLH